MYTEMPGICHGALFRGYCFFKGNLNQLKLLRGRIRERITVLIIILWILKDCLEVLIFSFLSIIIKLLAFHGCPYNFIYEW
jgi:hypothetical protein